jgi:cysteinyl-tRNA synthetase
LAARPAITFDVVYRYLTHLGYKVRYVRNITDVGHLEHDADEGEDKIAKKARLEQLEPMEVAQYYTNRYHAAMEKLNVLPPSIEPHASGHIMEQIALVQQILDAGYAYVSNGSVYFDVRKYQENTHKYGQLSGRVIDEMLATTRDLDGQDEKRFSGDFALWKKAAPEHIMRWPSPWSDGFPGWHAECTAMGAKYLGSPFDIHGGGMDLVFPHHESEIAQCVASTGHAPCRYWMHNNMITIEGQKMGKSLGNFITLDEFFTGSHKDKDGKEMLEQPYSPMTIRFFILQAHYRSTLDFSNEALQAAEKGYRRLMDAWKALGSVSGEETPAVAAIRDKVEEALCDDMNTPIAIAHLFEAVKLINGGLGDADKAAMKKLFDDVVGGVLGLVDDEAGAGSGKWEKALDAAMDIVLEARAKVRAEKNWAESDRIRDLLASAGISVKDTKDGPTWSIN